jgi:hypothetical protein
LKPGEFAKKEERGKREEGREMRKELRTFFLLLCVFICGNIYAQEFGFGNDDGEDSIEDSIDNSNENSNDNSNRNSNDNSSKRKTVNVTVGGEASASLLGYIDDFSEGMDYIHLGDIFSGKLKFKAGTSFADGVINLNIQPTEQPVSIDEAYVRAFFGGLEIEGGLRKLTWGKADSFGPLDVINPLDYSELTDLSDPMNLKIARPLIHASIRIGSFSKIEGVFVPYFEPLRYASDNGRWEPVQIKELNNLPVQIKNQLVTQLGANGIDTSGLSDIKVKKPEDITTLEYLQAGARFTTTIGSADIGLQYYYGRLNRPAISVTFSDFDTNVSIPMPPMQVPITVSVPTAINYAYNPYHQIGIDWAQILLGFNVRAEVAINLTEDLDGDDGSVYNPTLAWSFGFDRDLFWGINLNLQCNESIILMHDKIGSDPLLDFESGKDITSTQIIAAISKKFFRDELELRFAALWGIEDEDYLLMPAIIWIRDTVSVEFSAGIFGGHEEGQFGQYYKNNFIKVVLTYSF